MKLMYKIICVIVVIGVLSTVSYLLLSDKIEENKTTSENNIFSFDDATIDSMIINNESGEYKFQKVDNVWQLKDNTENFKINSTKMSTITEYMSSLTATQVIEDDASDLSIYGLDNPIVVECISSSNKKYTIEMGNATPTNSGYYVKKEGKNTVYAISAGDGVQIRATRDDIKDLYILDVVQSVVTKLYFEHDGKVIFNLSKDSIEGWQISEPIVKEINMANISSMIDYLIRAKVTSFVEENPDDLSQYGLDKPKYVIEIGTADETVKLLLGDYQGEDESEIYGLFPATNQVVTFNVYDIGILDKKTSDVLINTVHWVDMSDISKVTLIIDDELSTLDVSGETDEDTVYKFNDAEIDSTNEDILSAYKKLYSATAGVYFENVDTQAKPAGDAEITIEYTLLDGSNLKLEYIPVGDGTYYYAVENGEYTGLIVNGIVFDHQEGIRNTKQILIDAIS